MNAEKFTPEDLQAVSVCRLFDGCTDDEIRRFLDDSGVNVCSFRGGEVLPSEVRAGSWGIVIAGSVRIFSGDEGGGAMLLNVVSSGQPFDISSLAGCKGSPVMSEVRAAGKSRIAFVGAMDTMRLLKDYPGVGANCMGFFCGRIAFLNRKIHTLSRATAEQKLADYLLSEFSAEGGRAEVRVKSCVELAVRLNLSRASLYRALGILEQSGCIARNGKSIELLDVAALQNI